MSAPIGNDPAARQRLAARIQALLAKTTAKGCTEAEADAAAAKAMALMREQGMALSEVEAAAEPMGFGAHDTRYKARRHLVGRLVRPIGRLTGCKGWIDFDFMPVAIRYFGRAHEVQIAVYLTAIAQGALDRGMREYRARLAKRRKVRKATLTRQVTQFGIAMADRMDATLHRMAAELDQAKTSDGQALVVVRSAAVDAAWTAQGIALEEVKIGRVDPRHSRSRIAGWLAGGAVTFDPGLAGPGGQGPRAIGGRA